MSTSTRLDERADWSAARVTATSDDIPPSDAPTSAVGRPNDSATAVMSDAKALRE
jgi:hypothetical protein